MLHRIWRIELESTLIFNMKAKKKLPYYKKIVI